MLLGDDAIFGNIHNEFQTKSGMTELSRVKFILNSFLIFLIYIFFSFHPDEDFHFHLPCAVGHVQF